MKKTQLSINVNKIALLRNSRGENKPNVLSFSNQCIALGADGITVHPRPDGRHIKYEDVYDLKKELTVELNVEGYPSKTFLDLVTTVKPAQVTLVPDPPEALTSSFGWDTKTHEQFLKDITIKLHNEGCRVSLFVDPESIDIPSLLNIKTDRVELYTYDYARQYLENPEKAIAPYITAAKKCTEAGIGLNAGHDLDQKNLAFLLQHIPEIEEVSIGHALITDCIYQGLDACLNTYTKVINNVLTY
jgi:pyridoxine 5-phosphate synthase